MHVRLPIGRHRSRLAAFVAAVFAATLTARAAAPDVQKLIKEKSPALVTIKFVLKVSMPMMGGEEQESETEITGVVVDPKGVVLCSNTQLAGFVGLMKKIMGPMGGQITATPTDLKVLIGDDAEGKDAELVARDTELDLAWVRIKEPGDKPLEHLDLKKSATAEVGQPIVVVRRLGKYFARNAVISESRIGGSTSKPRQLFVPGSAIGMTLGLPVFAADGDFLGVMISQVPESEDGEFNPMAMMGMISEMQDSMTGLILPASEVAKATARALESAGKK